MANSETWVLKTTVRRTVLLAVTAGLLVLPLRHAEASGIGHVRMTVDFTKPEEAAGKARWSLPDRIRCGKDGLTWTAREGSSVGLSLHVTQALAIGHSWWAATNANVSATAVWSGWPAGAVHGHLYLRHSPDARSWTDWHQLPIRPTPDKDAGSHTYSVGLNIPHAKATSWTTLVRRRYMATNPGPADRTESAAAAWIESRSPGYLARAKPFFGYMQFLYESEMKSSRRLLRMDIDVRYVIPGPSHPPVVEGQDRQALWREPWNYRAGAQQLRTGTPEREAAARDVISSALEALVGTAGAGLDGKAPVKGLMLMDRTAVGPDLDDLALDGGPRWMPRLDGLTEDGAQDFARRNRETRLLPVGVQAGVAIIRGNREHGQYVKRKAKSDHAWERFHARNKGSLGMVWVSEPGFRDDGTQAVVHVGRMWNRGEGRGRFYLLRKTDDAWVVTATHETWQHGPR